MKVLVFAGTGFVGHSLVPLLRQRGHEVMVLTRRPELPPRLASLGVRGLQGDLLAPSILELEVGDVDAMVLLAAPRLFGKRLGNRRFRELKAELAAIHSNALELARRCSCPILLTSGASFQTVGDQVADESWPLARFGAARVGEDIDVLVARAVASGTPKVVWMLPGQVYGPGGMFLRMCAMAKKGRSVLLGDGSNYLPRIHVEDCAAAYAAALDRLDTLATGERFIVADDEPCTTREFADRLAELLHAPKPRPPPMFIVRLLLGRRLVETATSNGKVSNAKAKRVLGWAPRYPSIREGLPATLEAIDHGDVAP